MSNHRLTIGIDTSRAFGKDPAGPEYYSRNLIQNIAKLDKVNHYILYLREGQNTTFNLPPNFTAKYIRLPLVWTQLGLAIETILHPPDVLFITAHTLPLLTSFLLPQLPIIVTVHGLEGKFLPQSDKAWVHFYRNWSIGWAVRYSAGLIAVSEDTRQDVVKTFCITKPIKVIHEGVDLARFGFSNNPNYKLIESRQIKEVKAKYGVKNNYILFVGTVQPRKNLNRLIQAFTKIKDKKIDLIVAGKLGWNYTTIMSAPKRYGVEKRVKFIGRVDDNDLPRLYQGADLFILVSITEGFGLPVLEAQASGVPVIVSQGGALPEVAGHGALIANPLSVQEITVSIDKILSKTALGRQLVKNGYENVKQYTWERAARSTIDFLTSFHKR